MPDGCDWLASRSGNYTPSKESCQQLLIRLRLSRPLSRSESCGKEKNLLPLPRLKPLSLGPPACRLSCCCLILTGTAPFLQAYDVWSSLSSIGPRFIPILNSGGGELDFYIPTFNFLESKWDYGRALELIVEDSKIGHLL